jgi:hypothetical protein
MKTLTFLFIFLQGMGLLGAQGPTLEELKRLIDRGPDEKPLAHELLALLPGPGHYAEENSLTRNGRASTGTREWEVFYGGGSFIMKSRHGSVGQFLHTIISYDAAAKVFWKCEVFDALPRVVRYIGTRIPTTRGIVWTLHGPSADNSAPGNARVEIYTGNSVLWSGVFADRDEVSVTEGKLRPVQ